MQKPHSSVSLYSSCARYIVHTVGAAAAAHITLGPELRNRMASVNQQKKTTFSSGQLIALIGWHLFYLSFAHPSRPRCEEWATPKDGGEQPIRDQTTTRRIRAVAWYRQMMPNGQRRAGTA